LKAYLRAALHVLLSSYVANGLVAGVGLLVISTLVQLGFGAAAGAAATVGVIVVTPPDQPSPRRGKFVHLLPAAVVGVPLYCATLLLRNSPLGLPALLVGASFAAFLGGAWGKRGLPISISAMFSMIFALATPAPADTRAALQETFHYALGAGLYLLWGTAANALLNRRYRVLMVVESLSAVAALMRTQGLHFTMPLEAQKRTALVGRLMQQQAALADQLQTARNILLENPTTPRRQQLAGMLMHVLDMRDHLVACALDLETLRSAPEHAELLVVLGTEIQALAGDVEDLVDALLLHRPVPAFVHTRPALASAMASANASSTSDVDAPAPHLLASAVARRVGYVHDEVVRLFAVARGEREPDVDVVRIAWQLFVSPAAWSWRPLLGLWRWDAPPLRHAMRAALAIAAGYAAGELIPWGSHEYWILLTIVVVLRGSLSQTLERRNNRVAGTVLGCVIAGAVLAADPPARVLLLTVVVGQAIAHAFAIRRYLVTAVAATVLALVQAHLLDPSHSAAFEVAERLVDTAIGVLIAWVFSYVLPSWERTQVGTLVQRTLAAQAKHAERALALGQSAFVDSRAETAWRLARREVYDSLSALVQAVQRSLSEPRAVRPPLQDLERMVGHSYQLLAQLTAIKTMLLQRRDRLSIASLQQPLEQATQAITAVLSGAAPRTPPAADTGEVMPMLQVSDPAQGDLSPWLLRRLQLAEAVAYELKTDADRALAGAG
jgi:uncharacterized membrane protein YccC